MNNNTAASATKFQPKGKTKVITGSILNPETGGLRFILSPLNTLGKPEHVLMPIFDKRWAAVRRDIKGFYSNKTGTYKMGYVNTTAVQSDVWILHMLFQNDKFETDVKGLELCLKEVCKMAKYEKASVHVSNLLLDKVPEMKELLTSKLVDEGVSVYTYTE
jgi:hypothetical protein